MRKPFIRLVALALALAAPLPALAFDGLDLAIAFSRPRSGTVGEWIFSHAASPSLFVKLQTPPPLEYALAASTFTTADLGLSLTGIDLARATSLAVSGHGQEAVLQIAGPRDIAAGAAKALAARGFRTSKESGFTVYSRGEDNAVAPLKREAGDPFGADKGRSQRIAVFDSGIKGLVLVAHADAPLKAMMERMQTDCVHCPLMIPLAAMARVGGGDDERVLAASGHTLASSVAHGQAGTRFITEMLKETDPAKLAEKLKAAPPPVGAGLAPFLGAIVIVTRERGGTRLQVVAQFADEASAERAADLLAKRLGAIDRPGETFEITREWKPFLGGGLAIAAVRRAGDEGRGGLSEYRRWMFNGFDKPLLAVPD